MYTVTDWTHRSSGAADAMSRHYVAMYITEPEQFRNDKGDMIWMNSNWWKKDSTVYDTFDEAEAARLKFQAENEELIYKAQYKNGIPMPETFSGAKVQVWSVQAWNRLAEGFKHPADRNALKLKPKASKHSFKRMASKYDTFNEVEGSMARALRAAGI